MNVKIRIVSDSNTLIAEKEFQEVTYKNRKAVIKNVAVFLENNLI